MFERSNDDFLNISIASLKWPGVTSGDVAWIRHRTLTRLFDTFTVFGYLTSIRSVAPIHIIRRPFSGQRVRLNALHRYCHSPSMGTWAIAQIGCTTKTSKTTILECRKLKLSCKGALRHLASRVYAGIMGKLFWEIMQQDDPSPKQNTCVTFKLLFHMFWSFSLLGALGVESPRRGHAIPPLPKS